MPMSFERARRRARGRACEATHGQPRHWVQYQEAAQRAPQRASQPAGGHARRNGGQGLLDAHPALVVAPGQRGVLQINKGVLLQVRAELEDLLGVLPPVEAEHHQVGHIGPLNLR